MNIRLIIVVTLKRIALLAAPAGVLFAGQPATPAAPATSPAPATTTPAAAASGTTTEEEEIVQMDPWQVTGTVVRGYGSTASIGGSRINLPLVDVPLSVITVNRQLMNDVSAINSYDALRFVSGM